MSQVNKYLSRKLLVIGELIVKGLELTKAFPLIRLGCQFKIFIL